MNKNKAIIVCVIIVAVTIIAAFYILNSGKKPVSSNSNQALVVSDKQPSKTLKEYSDISGFSFEYPEDIQVSQKDSDDPAIYSNLEMTSSNTEGAISVKVLDTKLDSVDDWFLENKLIAKKEIKIGEISGKEASISNRIVAAALDQNILFIIEVNSEDQKYWGNVHDTLLSSFSFISQQAPASQSSSDGGSDDVVLEEETVE